MPHIEIKCFSGRSEEQKKLCAEKVAQAAADALGCKLSSVSVAVIDVQQQDWKKDVWDKQIVPCEEFMYKKPEYKCD
jgi:4-oxalocrotonate tautomerase